jgi:hypothetical protein
VDDSIRMLVSRLATLDDPRQAGKVTFPLVEMSMVAVAGIIAQYMKAGGSWNWISGR